MEEALLTGMLGPHGVDLDDIELINVNFSLSPAIMSGQVDAVIGAFRNFELNQMDIEGEKGRCFFLEEEGIPAYDELIYVANPKRMNIEQIRRFIKATELATQYIINNPEKSWNIFSGTAKELQNELNKRAWVDTLPRFALRPAAFDKGRYLDFQSFLKNSGLITTEADISDIAIDISAD